MCTFSALVLKGRVMHLFHIGDSRVFRLHPQSLEQLTEDHRIGQSATESYLARALGTGSHVDVDHRNWEATAGEIYVLATDGAYSHVNAAAIHQALARHPTDLDAAAAELVQRLLLRGKTLKQHIAKYKNKRGMDFYHDVRDWIGGYPYESIAPEPLKQFLADQGFECVKAIAKRRSGLFGSGCDEYVFKRVASTTSASH